MLYLRLLIKFGKKTSWSYRGTAFDTLCCSGNGAVGDTSFFLSFLRNPQMFARAPLPEQRSVSKGAFSAKGCRNKFGMTHLVADCFDQGVILNSFQDLSAHSEWYCSLCLLPHGALHPASAFDTPNHIIADFKVFFGLLRQRLWWQISAAAP